jgi:hypothetical protein
LLDLVGEIGTDLIERRLPFAGNDPQGRSLVFGASGLSFRFGLSRASEEQR